LSLPIDLEADMPELWLTYGERDVVLDIKVENLNEFRNSKFNNIQDQDLAQQIEITSLDNLRIFAAEGSRSVARIISIILNSARKNSISSLPIECFPEDYPLLSKTLEGETLGIVKDTDELLNRTNDSKTVFVSTVKADPLFGFRGIPTKLLRKCSNEKMSEAFASRKTNLPNPGLCSPPLQLALDFCKNMCAQSLHVINSNFGIDSLFAGSIVESFRSGMNKIESLGSDGYYNTRSMIICGDRDSDSHLQLSDSLRNLWNCVHVLKNGGFGILLSENKNGLGSVALQRFTEGKLGFEDVYNNDAYLEGLEHLMFMNELREKYRLGILSSLPHYYLDSKFGFQTFSKSRDAVAKLLELNGKTHKILVISDPNLALFNFPLTDTPI
jgi:hypothetical protein